MTFTQQILVQHHHTNVDVQQYLNTGNNNLQLVTFILSNSELF